MGSKPVNGKSCVSESLYLSGALSTILSGLKGQCRQKWAMHSLKLSHDSTPEG